MIINKMTKHQSKKKSKLSAAPSQQQQQQQMLTPEQLQQQQMEERLQIYRPELRESIKQQKILQRRKNNKSQ